MFSSIQYAYLSTFVLKIDENFSILLIAHMGGSVTVRVKFKILKRTFENTLNSKNFQSLYCAEFLISNRFLVLPTYVDKLYIFS